MRKNQLSFKIESFGDQAQDGYNQKLTGYIDGNGIYEVLSEELKVIHGIYGKGTSFSDFLSYIRDYDDKQRLGRTQCALTDHKNNPLYSIDTMDGSEQ